MKTLLKLNPSSIFLILAAGIILSNISITNDPTTNSILRIIGVFIYILYPFCVGYYLNTQSGNKFDMFFNLFIINGFVWFATYSVVIILSDGRGMTFSGLAAIPIFYVFYAIIHFFAFPAKNLKSIELNKKAQLGDYIGDIFLFILLPIGIWYLQPRITKIINEEKII